MSQIAKEQGINSGTVYYYIDKHDIQTRDRIDAVKDAVRVPRANYHMTSDGHMRWQASVGNGEEKACYVARLLAVAEFGFDAVKNKEIHHKNEIPWDNRPENIEPLSAGDHSSHHNKGRDQWKDKSTPWRDKGKLEELYVDKKMNQNEIANKYDVAASTIGRWLRKFDIPVRSISEAKQLEEKK